MPSPAGSTPPEHLTIWFAEGSMAGLDVRWMGHSGVRRAARARDRLCSAGHDATLIQDDLGWRVRTGPMDRATIGEIIDHFLDRH